MTRRQLTDGWIYESNRVVIRSRGPVHRANTPATHSSPTGLGFGGTLVMAHHLLLEVL